MIARYGVITGLSDHLLPEESLPKPVSALAEGGIAQMRTGLTIRSTCTGETGSSTQSEKARHEVLLMESGLFALTLQ